MKTLTVSIVLIFITFTAIQGQNHPPVAVNDTVSAFPDYPIYVNLLKNDYDPDGDSIFVLTNLQKVNDTTWMLPAISFSWLSYEDTIWKRPYFIKDIHDSIAGAMIVVRFRALPTADFLDANNINALISPFGNHFWDSEESRFEVPKGSGRTALFSHSCWIGGLDEQGMLHLAGEYYRQQGVDFAMGPISNSYDSSYMLKWNRVWKLDKEKIRYHINNWSHAGYIPIDAIANWPAHGNTSLGQTSHIAPFRDVDLDGKYSPEMGDYPLIRGDQAIFFIINDQKETHTESDGAPLGVEIHGMAYAYDQPDDSTLKNTAFIHLDFLNKSGNIYQDTYLGLFTAFDLGYSDDFTGCDVAKGMAYSYNADSFDGDGNPPSYGLHPPALGMKVIAGPLQEPDGIDNPKGLCDEGINGLNFGDGTSDNERMGLSHYVTGWKTGANHYAPDFYQIMRSLRPDNTPCMYGDSLLYSSWFFFYSYGGLGPSCRYYYPGNSDTLCNYGTGGIPPLGGYNQNGKYWTESSVSNNPGYREGIGSVGPFTFSPGQSVPLDYCFTWARDYDGDNLSSLELLQERVTQTDVQWNEWIRLPETYISVPENIAKFLLQVFPNPSKGYIKVISPFDNQSNYYIYDLSGKPVLTGFLSKGVNSLDISSLASGVYILKCAASVARIQKI